MPSVDSATARFPPENYPMISFSPCAPPSFACIAVSPFHRIIEFFFPPLLFFYRILREDIVNKRLGGEKTIIDR